MRVAIRDDQNLLGRDTLEGREKKDIETVINLEKRNEGEGQEGKKILHKCHH